MRAPHLFAGAQQFDHFPVPAGFGERPGEPVSDGVDFFGVEPPPGRHVAVAASQPSHAMRVTRIGASQQGRASGRVGEGIGWAG